MGRIVCVSNCVHQRGGECKLDYTALTGDMSSVQCFDLDAKKEEAGESEAGEESEIQRRTAGAEPGRNRLWQCQNR